MRREVSMMISRREQNLRTIQTTAQERSRSTLLIFPPPNIMSTGNLLPLVRSNIAILSQKIALLDLMVSRHGVTTASTHFITPCPIVGATIGEHYRHSMDHVELVALVADTADKQSSSSSKSDMMEELHYDLRVRGGTLEKDMDMSRKRLVDVVAIFKQLEFRSPQQQQSYSDESISSRPIATYFNLSADTNDEIRLLSTIGRELGFAAHHAIHHMAMVKIIATKTLGYNENELPHGFGRAPSTLLFDGKKLKT
jgi:hypothetical protein